MSLRGETATIDANGTINVQLNRVSCLSPVRPGEKAGEAGHVEKMGRREEVEHREGRGAREYRQTVKAADRFHRMHTSNSTTL